MLRLSTSAVAIGAILAIAACESSGHTRYASVGTVGPQGEQGAQGPAGEQGAAGPQGPAGPAGADGADGADGMNGADGGNFTLGDTGMIATGGLVGPDGIASTGLLANLGDPNSAPPAGGDALAQLGGTLDSAGTQMDSLVANLDAPAELTGITGAVTSTVSNVGTALADFGTDGAPLVDGVTSSVSPVLTAGIGGGTLAGGEGDSLLGVSVLSTEQQSGGLAEVGVASGASLLNVDLSPTTDSGLDIGNLANVDLGPVTDGVGQVLDQAGLTDLGETGNVGGLGDITQPVTDLLTNADLPEPEKDGVIGGLLGGLGIGGNQ